MSGDDWRFRNRDRTWREDLGNKRDTPVNPYGILGAYIVKQFLGVAEERERRLEN